MFLSSNFLTAQEIELKYQNKVESIDSIVPAIFEIVSGEKGEERDWELMKTIFHPEARLILNHPNSEGESGIYFFTIEEYIERFAASFREMDLYEQEVHRITNKFGNMVQVYSTYASFKNEEEKDLEPQKQGMAGIQLYHDGERWWVITMYWKNAINGLTIPDKYLPPSDR